MDSVRMSFLHVTELVLHEYIVKKIKLSIVVFVVNLYLLVLVGAQQMDLHASPNYSHRKEKHNRSLII